MKSITKSSYQVLQQIATSKLLHGDNLYLCWSSYIQTFNNFISFSILLLIVNTNNFLQPIKTIETDYLAN